MTSSAATRKSYEQLIAAEPVLGRIGRLDELIPALPARTLFHAGPPYARVDDVPPPVLNSICAAAHQEGWIAHRDELMPVLRDGGIRIMPAQDVGLVTPLAFVAGPAIFCLEVVDANAPDRRRLSPLNDGPLPDALRFGTGRDAGTAMLRRLTDSVAPDLARHARPGKPLLQLLAAGLEGGDDLHGHLAAAQSRVIDLFDEGISADSRTYIAEANQFVLNVVMATAATMLAAAAGVDESELVVAAGGNGVDFGYRLSTQPDAWITMPASPPQGPKLPGLDAAAALPAIGDSAVIDALGLGAACLRYCPTLRTALEGHVSPAYFTPAAHRPFVGPHPAFADDGLHVGLDLTRPRTCLGIMLGMVGATGADGLVGRGISPWPSP